MAMAMLMLVGLLIGAQDGMFGATVGAAIGWLLMRTVRQSHQIQALQDDLKALQSTVARVETWEHTSPAAAAHAALQVIQAPAPTPAAPSTPMPVRAAAPPASLAPSDVPAPAIAMQDSAPPARPAPVPAPVPEQWSDDVLTPLRRWLTEGNLIVKAGIAILFLGLAFLAKYVGEQVQVPVEWRLAGIGSVAVVLLAVGWRLREHRAAYAQVLQGGAVAVLYLTLFAAFRFYGVLAAGPAFALMAMVAALSAALAVLQNARALAVVGALGGFATPLLLSTGNGNQVALFAYYLVLDLGIAAVAWHTTWRSLNLIGFAATFIVGTAWGVMRYEDAHYASSQAFLITYFLLFNAILLMPVRRLGTDTSGTETIVGHDTRPWVDGSLLFGLPTITFALQVGLLRDTAFGVALSALAMAAFYVLMAWRLHARAGTRPGLTLMFEASLAIGTVFLSLVIPFALDARETAGAWALEGAGLVWLGVRQSRLSSRGFGYLLLALSGGALLLAFDRQPAASAVFNGFLFNGVMVALGALIASHVVRRLGAVAKGEANLAEVMLIVWATAWALITMGHQIALFVPPRLVMAVALASLSGLAALYLTLSQRLAWPRLTLPVMGHAPVLVLGLLINLLALHDPLLRGGWWAWPVALGVHAAVLRLAAPGWLPPARHTVHLLGVLIVAGLLALKGRVITGDWGDAASAWPWLGWLVGPALLLLWLTRADTARRWPVSAEPAAYRTTGGALLTAGMLLWTLLANFTSDGSARPLPALPLLNPLDLGVATALLASWHWLRSTGARCMKLVVVDPRALGVLAGAGFVWLNAMLIRAFHHHGGVPFHVDDWMASLAVQTGLTLLWSATALVLMLLASRRGWRLPWMGGAALLGLVMLKLLLVDLSGSGTVTRIVSFIGVGVLMLVIGYVAPLPDSESRPDEPKNTDEIP
jgi:uncharacterized membrane protein